MTTSPETTKDEGMMQAVLEKLDALKDDAAVHIHPDNLDKCSRSECVVKVCSVRVTDVETGVKYLPLFSREQVETAIREALAQPDADDKAGAYIKALEIRTEQGWNLTGGAIPVLYTDTINGQQVCRDDVWLCTTAALRKEDDKAGGEVVAYQNPDLEHMAEEAECVSKCLDDRGVPKTEDEKSLSLWGRVCRYKDGGWEKAATHLRCPRCGHEREIKMETARISTRPQPQADQPAERVALTDEQWLKKWTRESGERLKPGAQRDRLLRLFKFAEAAHGITAKDQS